MQKWNIDHQPTKTALENILAGVKSLGSQYINGHEQIEKLQGSGSIYSADHIDAEIKKIKDSLSEAGSKFIDAAEAEIDKIRDQEEKNNEALDFSDATLQGILHIIGSMHDGMISRSVVDSALQQMAGNRKALDAIEAALTAKGFELTDTEKEIYFYNIEGSLENLFDSCIALGGSPAAPTLYPAVKEKIVKLGESLGLEFSENELDLGQVEELIGGEALRQVMGLV